jgi:hypothetical protein
MERRTDIESAMLLSIDHLIELLGQRYAELSAAHRGATRGATALPDPELRLQELERFIERLEQIKTMLKGDRQLLVAADNFIGQHVEDQTRRLQRQSRRLAIWSAILGVGLGWLVSALAKPQEVLQFFHLFL